MTRHPKVAFHFPCWSLTNQFAHGVLMINPKACSERCKLPRNAARWPTVSRVKVTGTLYHAFNCAFLRSLKDSDAMGKSM